MKLGLHCVGTVWALHPLQTSIQDDSDGLGSAACTACMAHEAGRQRGRLYRDIDVSPRNAWLALGVEAKVLEAGGTTVGRGSVGATAGRGSVLGAVE